jgi:hypothetical protein
MDSALRSSHGRAWPSTISTSLPIVDARPKAVPGGAEKRCLSTGLIGYGLFIVRS